MALKEGARQDAKFMVMSICPDVCKSPAAPVPYPIVGYLDKSILISPNVRSKGKFVFHMGSRVATVIGDEAGVGGGVTSQVIKGFCKPIVPVPTVRVNKQFANHNDITHMLMNGASPEGPFNTIGQLLLLDAMFFGDVGPGGTIPADSDPPVQAESFAEGGCMPDLASLGGGGSGGGIGDIVGMAKQAYGLATTDWSNPSAILGAVGGVAGMSGMGQIAQAAGMASQAYNLATADWSNPGAAMGAVMGIAGPAIGGMIGGGSRRPSSNTTGGFAGGHPAKTGSRNSSSGKGFPPGIVACSGFGC